MLRRLAPLATILVAANLAAVAGLASDTSLLMQKNASASPSVKPKPMIARIWHGRTLTAKADEYERYLNASGVERMLKTDGNHGVEVLRKADGPRTDFVVILVLGVHRRREAFRRQGFRKGRHPRPRPGIPDRGGAQRPPL